MCWLIFVALFVLVAATIVAGVLASHATKYAVSLGQAPPSGGSEAEFSFRKLVFKLFQAPQKFATKKKI